VQEQVLTFSKEEKEKLEIYSSLLKNWQKKFNLVSSASLYVNQAGKNVTF